MIDYKRLMFTCVMTDYMLMDCKPDEAERMLRNYIAGSMANHIKESLEKTPHLHTTERDEDIGGERHKVYFNLISDDELRRLREIERLYSINLNQLNRL